MRKIWTIVSAVAGFAAMLTADAAAQPTVVQSAKEETKTMTEEGGGAPGLTELNRMEARFAPTPLKVDISRLSANDRNALAKLVQAAQVVDFIFMDQYWSGDRALWEKLRQDGTPLGAARASYFWLNKSPWSSLDGEKAFLPGVPQVKLPGANFYPEDMSKPEFETWLAKQSPEAHKLATGFFSVIVRNPSPEDAQRLVVVPYSKAYRKNLETAAGLLREAAALTGNTTLKRFLTTRADAFLNDDYYASDVAWMDLDAPIDVTIGPYETYNDEIYGYKASFEAYVNVRDDRETEKLGAFSKHLQEIEDHLPIDAKYRNPKLGTAAPIRVVNEVFGAGDGNHGVQTAAYNLPNDERVTTERGTKRVMLRNVQEAKFNNTLVPIANSVLATDAQGELSFDWFFTHILAHELSHGLGPHQITIHGQQTSPREQLKDLYSALEEAKADALGLFALQYMLDHEKQMALQGVLPKDKKDAAEKKLYTTYLASSFRTLRFGLHEAHGRGMALQVNYLMDKGAFTVNKDGTFAVDYAKVKSAVRDLVHDLLMLEATGDYEGTKKLLETAVLRPEFKHALDKLNGVPTDIRPLFVTAEELTEKK
jgi:hypothetical protein